MTQDVRPSIGQGVLHPFFKAGPAVDKAAATAAPVSPEVAPTIVTRSPRRFRANSNSCPISCEVARRRSAALAGCTPRAWQIATVS